MGAARKIRRQVVAEDADDAHYLYVTDGADDALDHAVHVYQTWPEWICDVCCTRNAGDWFTCSMCAAERTDVDP